MQCQQLGVGACDTPLPLGTPSYDGPKALYANYVPDSFLLRSGDGAAPFGRN
eukprot:COSAG03_NODE_353_length_8690_cov_4.738680_10_plen_52_part_00